VKAEDVEGCKSNCGVLLSDCAEFEEVSDIPEENLQNVDMAMTCDIQ